MKKRHLVEWSRKETVIHIPNEIFNDLQNNIKSSAHVAFAYSYYFLINYLYKYVKYGKDYKFTQSAIKKFLGYNPANKRIDYIIKKDGILDEIGYTKTITDYPNEVLQVELGDKKYLQFTMFSKYKTNNFDEVKVMGLHNDRNFKIKYPVKAFYRNDVTELIQEMNGTFYDVTDTHGIEIDAFLTAIEDEKIGVMGFYIYGYIKHLIGLRGGQWRTVSTEELAKGMRISKTTLIDHTKRLESNLLKVVRQDYFNNPEGKANNYRLRKNAK